MLEEELVRTVGNKRIKMNSYQEWEFFCGVDKNKIC